VQLTVKQAAALMGVSERMVYMAKAVLRLRLDLETDLATGAMSMREAYRIATGRKKQTGLDRLVTAWRNAADDERVQFMAIICDVDEPSETREAA
jgi:hypothetical protein